MIKGHPASQNRVAPNVSPESVFSQKISLIVRSLFMTQNPSLVAPEVSKWSDQQVARIERRLIDRSLVQPLPIVITWLVAVLALLASVSVWALDPLGSGRFHAAALFIANSIAIGTAYLALINSVRLLSRTTRKYARFARFTPLQKLYAVNAAIQVFVIAVLSLGGLFLTVGLILRAWSASVETQRAISARLQCSSNLSQIAMALHNYVSAQGVLPPRYITDRTGNPLYSWRVLLLPYNEENAAYNAFNYSAAWDAPENLALSKKVPAMFRCPSEQHGADEGATSYLAVVGQGTALGPPPVFSAAGVPPISRCPKCGAITVASSEPKLSSITDGTSNTLIVAEVKDSNVAWTAPFDLEIGDMTFRINGSSPTQLSISSHHAGGAFAAFANGQVRFLRDSMTPSILKSLLTASGGEVISSDAY